MKPVRTEDCNFTYHLGGGTEANDLPCEVDETSVLSAWVVEEDDDLDSARSVRVQLHHPVPPKVEIGWNRDELIQPAPVPYEDGFQYGLEIRPGAAGEAFSLALGARFFLKVHERPTPAVTVWLSHE